MSDARSNFSSEIGQKLKMKMLNMIKMSDPRKFKFAANQASLVATGSGEQCSNSIAAA